MHEWHKNREIDGYDVELTILAHSDAVPHQVGYSSKFMSLLTEKPRFPQYERLQQQQYLSGLL